MSVKIDPVSCTGEMCWCARGCNGWRRVPSAHTRLFPIPLAAHTLNIHVRPPSWLELNKRPIFLYLLNIYYWRIYYIIFQLLQITKYKFTVSVPDPSNFQGEPGPLRICTLTPPPPPSDCNTRPVCQLSGDRRPGEAGVVKGTNHQLILLL